MIIKLQYDSSVYSLLIFSNSSNFKLTKKKYSALVLLTRKIKINNPLNILHCHLNIKYHPIKFDWSRTDI